MRTNRITSLRELLHYRPWGSSVLFKNSPHNDSGQGSNPDRSLRSRATNHEAIAPTTQVPLFPNQNPVFYWLRKWPCLPQFKNRLLDFIKYLYSRYLWLAGKFFLVFLHLFGCLIWIVTKKRCITSLQKWGFFTQNVSKYHNRGLLTYLSIAEYPMFILDWFW